MAHSNLAHWKAFLPERALVMARRAKVAPVIPTPQTELAFVGQVHGPAAELLHKMIAAMGLSLNQVTLLDGADSAELNDQLNTLRPKITVALGAAATQTLKNAGASEKTRVVPTFHPDELLTHPASKREAWAHLQGVARDLGISLPVSPKTPKNSTQG